MSPSLSDISLLFPSGGGQSGSIGNILQILSGRATGSAMASSDPIQALKSAESRQTQDIAAVAAEPSVQRQVADFTTAVQSATSVQQALADPKILNVLLTANGLGDQVQYPALAQKALAANPAVSGSLLDQLSDPRWKAVAQTYQFATAGLSILQNPNTVQTITQAYAEVAWRESLDATTPGLSNALTFRSEASSITSVDQILGDPVMRDVVTTALGVPQEIAFQSLSAQENAISSRLDIKRLSDASFVESFVQRYLLAKADSTSATQSTDFTSLAIRAQGLLA